MQANHKVFVKRFQSVAKSTFWSLFALRIQVLTSHKPSKVGLETKSQ